MYKKLDNCDRFLISIDSENDFIAHQK